MNAIEICNEALIKIGGDSISSFEDGTAEARVAARLYPLVRDAMLSAHPWMFALQLVNAKYGCFMPETILRVLDGNYSGRMWLHTGEVKCIGRVPEEDFPEYFAKALVIRLAAEFCLPLTEGASRADRLHRLADHELRLAKLADSQSIC